MMNSEQKALAEILGDDGPVSKGETDPDEVPAALIHLALIG